MHLRSSARGDTDALHPQTAEYLWEGEDFVKDRTKAHGNPGCGAFVLPLLDSGVGQVSVHPRFKVRHRELDALKSGSFLQLAPEAAPAEAFTKSGCKVRGTLPIACAVCGRCLCCMCNARARPSCMLSTLTTHSLPRACPMLPQASKMADHSRHRRGHLVGGGRARFRLGLRPV